jgi:hypothetical protein
MIAGIKENVVMYAFTKIRKASNKHFLVYLKTDWFWLIAESIRPN